MSKLTTNGVHATAQLNEALEEVERRSRATAGFGYLRWVQKTRSAKQAVLTEPLPKHEGTPEHFYYYEMTVRSTLEERARARGLLRNEE